jgi:DNA polymerase-3 subunit gamma/tau
MVSAPIPAAAVPIAPRAEIHGTTVVVPQSQPRAVVESRPMPAPLPVADPVLQLTDLAPPPSPQPSTVPAQPASLEEAQHRAIESLREAKQSSAADALEDSAWNMVEGEVRVQTELSKVMLPVVMNAEADKILRAVARAAGFSKLTLLPGASSDSAPKKPKAARVGSVQAKALEHPMVQQAQKLFNAEIQTVIDLREGE